MVRFSPTRTDFALPLWASWTEIALRQASLAEEHQQSDARLDARSAELAGEERERPSETEGQPIDEVFSAMVAVTAAAFALDAFYGSVRPLVNPWKRRGSRKTDPRVSKARLPGREARGPLATGTRLVVRDPA
jgi:hypothetical protein